MLMLLAFTACAPAPVGPSSPALPDHALGVGVRQVDLVDEVRETRANGDEPGHEGRDLPTRVWYPSVDDLDADEVEDATPDPGPWPLVVFVHGSQATPRAYGWFGRALARAGYVVVAADMPLTSLLTPGGPSDWHVQDQPADVAFLADQAFEGALGVPVDERPGYAVAGHSTGGTVALLAAWADGADARVSAILPMSGDACFFDDGFFQRRAVPLLALSGSDDLYVPSPINAERTYEFANAPKDLVVLRGGTHLGFTDLPLPDDAGVTPDQPGDPLVDTLAAYGDGSACTPLPAPSTDPTMALAEQHRLAAAWSVAFLDAVVREAPGARDALRAAGESADVRWE